METGWSTPEVQKLSAERLTSVSFARHERRVVGRRRQSALKPPGGVACLPYLADAVLFMFAIAFDSGQLFLRFGISVIATIFFNFDLCQRHAGLGLIVSWDKRRFSMVSFFGDHFPAIVVVSMLMFMVVLGGVSINEAVRGRRR